MRQNIHQLRKEFYDHISHLALFEKKRIIRKVDDQLLKVANHYEGKKHLHTLNYLHKRPSKFSEDKVDYILYLYRNILLFDELKNIRDKKKPELSIVK